MRLINTETLDFEEYFNPPSYAILSHRWSGEEVSFEEYSLIRDEAFSQMESFPYLEPRVSQRCHRIRSKTGYRKVVDCCAFARRRGAKWVWIDTCCIDKRSSAELSEAINSMFNWYRQARECYVHLFDVVLPREDGSDFGSELEEAVKASSWFTRCWTLQELLAPDALVFCSGTWNIIHEMRKVDQPAELRDLKAMSDEASQCWRWAQLLSRVTGIPQEVVMQADCEYVFLDYNIAQKMSWASRRQATRIEDEAYSLLGLFGVNMPLLYGEGSKAFLRLQRELMAQSRDETILVWRLMPRDPTQVLRTGGLTGLLAPDARCFAHSANVFEDHAVERPPYTINGNLLQLDSDGELLVWNHGSDARQYHKVYLVRLNCVLRDPVAENPDCVLALGSVTTNHGNDAYDIFDRVNTANLSAPAIRRLALSHEPFARRRFYIQL